MICLLTSLSKWRVEFLDINHKDKEPSCISLNFTWLDQYVFEQKTVLTNLQELKNDDRHSKNPSPFTPNTLVCTTTQL